MISRQFAPKREIPPVMKNGRKIIITLCIVLIAGLVAAGFDQPPRENDTPANTTCIERIVLNKIDSFRLFINNTFRPAVERNAPAEQIQRCFLTSRKLFKRFEWAAEYFMGPTTRFVNGPPVQDVENADLLDPVLSRPRDPAGLQVMEELIFPIYDGSNKKQLIRQIDILEQNCELYAAYFSNYHLADWRILDASKMELFRILTLGITGFDNPATLKSMEEATESLTSLKEILSFYIDRPERNQLIKNLDDAVSYLKTNTDFNSFDRASFITTYGNTISAGIAAIADKSGYPVRYNRMLRQEVRTLFDPEAFNSDAFIPGPEYATTPEKVVLGKKLFFDVALSGTGTRSCASCHLPDKAFTDGLVKNTAIHDAKTLLTRNTPTLLNVALQSNLFYDLRALTLEDQASQVINNKEEMDGSMRQILRYLQRKEDYKKLFTTAFHKEKDDTIDSVEVLNALAAYSRSLTKLNSRFDDYMRGNRTALTSSELKGFNLFMGKAKCATCHYMPLFNGMVPPKYGEGDAEVIGVPVSASEAVADPDSGWFKIVGVESYKHAFKTPTVRNTSHTAPYMHNGIYATLEEVMDFYNKGGGRGLGIKLKNQTLPEDSLHLTESEIADVVSFIKSLDSKR